MTRPLLPAATLAIFLGAAVPARAEVDLRERGNRVEMRNSKVEVAIDKGSSRITSIKLGRHELVGAKQVYYSMGGGNSYRQAGGAKFRVVEDSPGIAHVAFLQKWDGRNSQAVDIEVHYALVAGESGVHTYAILSHPADYPDSGVGEWRMVWGMPEKSRRDWLMERICVDERRNWEMPSPADLERARPTGIKEIIEVTRGPRKGEFDCKYDFNLEYHRVGCWGHASDRNEVGAWVVLPSHEFFNDGPTKQDLSSASGIIHIHFGMNHYNGSGTRLRKGEEWRKIYGPFMLYGNQGGGVDELWADARRKAAEERGKWPYEWVKEPGLYPRAAERGSVGGRLVVRDPLKPGVSAAGAWVGLAQPEPGGNWQFESNRYQYWTKAAADGSFTIPHIRPGTYHFYAFTDGVAGEFEVEGAEVAAGANDAGAIEWTVEHLGKRIEWEIGEPNRRADEFRLGDDYFHGYVWTRFSEDLKNPLVFKVGESDPATDWNFAQGAYLDGDRPQRWPWEIRFKIDDEFDRDGTARLVIAWASAESARVNVELNREPLTSIMPPNNGGNALLREGIHAKYGLSHVDFPAKQLRRGSNRIVLDQVKTQSAASHVMYDYIALELP